MNKRPAGSKRPRLALSAAVTLGLGAALVAPTAQAESTTPAVADRPDTVGRWIVDGQGRAVLPVGINLVNKKAPYTPQAIGFDEEDAAFLKAQGFDSVRLGINWAAVEPQPGQYDDAYLDKISESIRMLHRHGISTLVDSHQDMFHEQFQGWGFPTWAVQKDGWPNIIKAGFPNNQFFNTALQHAYDNLHQNKPGPGGVGLADRFAAAWGHTAERLKSTPGIIGFDLYNEPWPGTNWLSCLTTALCTKQDKDLEVMQQKMVNQIRAVDPKTPIFYEPYSTFNQGTQTNVRVTGKNVGFSFHDYCPGQFLFKTYGACAGQDAKVFANAEEHTKKLGQPSLMTEFGATKDATTLRKQSDFSMKSRIGWYYWQYSGVNDVATSGPDEAQAVVHDPTKPPTGDNIDWDKLSHLVVMHPRAVAGVPSAYYYDRDNGVFAMNYSTTLPNGSQAPESARTLISVPKGTSPNGYTVKVTGGKVVSAANAPVLEIVRDGSASTVSVTVTRS